MVTVGIRTENDVPKAFDPLKIINSKNNGPYASRTSLGRTINGPLLRQNSEQSITSYFVNADVMLNQVVMDAINRDFNESISYVKTEMSREEIQFMTKARDTSTLTNRFYTIALPFRNDDYQMPNNKEQVKQRARLLKHVLLKKPQLLCDSKTLIENLFNKSFPKRVPLERLHKKNRKVWYTPHHGVLARKNKSGNQLFLQV